MSGQPSPSFTIHSAIVPRQTEDHPMEIGGLGNGLAPARWAAWVALGLTLVSLGTIILR